MAQLGTNSVGRCLSVAVFFALGACSAREEVTPRDSGSADGGSADGGDLDAALVDEGMPVDAERPTDLGTDAAPGDAGPVACGAATPRFAGSLCGPGAAACVILRDERVEGGHSRNDAPAIALDSADRPAILYSIAEGGYRGMYATRGAAGAWSTVATGFELATGGLVFDGDTPTALAYDGAYHTDVYTLGASGWGRHERLPTDQVVSAVNVLRDEGGCLHVLGDPGTGMTGGTTTYLLRDATWHATAVGGGSQPRPSALALAPSGQPHVVWTESGGTTSELRWARGPAGSELVWAGGAGAGYGNVPRIGVSASSAIETPHVLFLVPKADGSSDLYYATRASAGSWSVVLLELGRPAGCTGTPVAGATCSADGLSFVPVAVIASGSGDVRLFWGRNHETGTLTGRCDVGPFPGGGGPPPPPPFCFWDGALTRDARLIVGTPGLPSAEVGAGIDLLTATAVLDGAGHVHIAAYDTASGGTGVRYLMVGAPL